MSDPVRVRSNVLLDTHVLLWWLGAPKKISRVAHEVLSDPEVRVYVSAAVAWEMAFKVNLGKLAAADVVAGFAGLVQAKGFFRLAISTDHALRAGLLPLHHADPFDRMLIAQAHALNCPIVSADARFDHYGVRRIW
jgi:PIN domain nuclease of toxin-antitoxin system